MPQNGVLGVIWAEISKKEVKITQKRLYDVQKGILKFWQKKSKMPILAKIAIFCKKFQKFQNAPKMVF